MISIAIYLAFRRQFIWATLIMSFLPFVRSEGLFLCGAFALYLIWMRQLRSLPLILLGHIFYSIAGYPYYKNFAWVLTNIPYVHADSHYGHGSWFYFLQQMPVISGLVNSVLLGIGIFGCIFTSLSLAIRKKWNETQTKALFIMSIFVLFFLMHTTFWALGIFGSFGMLRVFIAISSVIMLLMLSAIEYLDLLLSRMTRYHQPLVILLFITASSWFAFQSSTYAFNGLDFGLHPDQLRDRAMLSFIKKNYPDYKSYIFYFDALYMAEEMDLDVFGSKFFWNDYKVTSHPYSPHSFIIWDDFYSDFERGLHLETLRNNKSLKEITTIQMTDTWGGTRKSVLFVRDK